MKYLVITHTISCSFLRQLGRDSAGRGVALCAVCVPGGVLKAGEDAISRLPPASGTLRRDCPRSDTLWTRETSFVQTPFGHVRLHVQTPFGHVRLHVQTPFGHVRLVLFKHPLDT